jgi:hypothetical protein
MASQSFDFLAGKPVAQIWVWGPIRLVFELGASREPDAYVDVVDVTLVTAAGRSVELDVWESRGEAGAVLELLHQVVVGANAEDGILGLTFEGGDTLRSMPDEAHESWTVVGGGQVFQCLPGGELGRW